MLVRKRARLPHWDVAGATYFVTFNLADAIPKQQQRRIEAERAAQLAAIERLRGRATIAELTALAREARRRTEDLLDAGLGACWMRTPVVARIVQDALLYFDERRYQILAWCVMPNHVHSVFVLNAGYSIDRVLASWKKYTSRESNLVLGREGSFWQADYFDRVVRGERHLARAVAYVQRNPGSAGLSGWPWVGVYSERIGVME